MADQILNNVYPFIGRTNQLLKARTPMTIKYGLLYNWYAAVDSRNIASNGWHVSYTSEWGTLNTYLGGSTVAGGKMKETGITYWNPNTGATNSSGFNGRGAGSRSSGMFTQIQTYCFFITYDYLVNQSYYGSLSRANDDFSLVMNINEIAKKSGFPIRLVKDSTNLTNGQTGVYLGNDGKLYRTICIGTQEWLADNLCETKYRNGDSIPEITDQTTWDSLTTGALCAYSNNWSNAY